MSSSLNTVYRVKWLTLLGFAFIFGVSAAAGCTGTAPNSIAPVSTGSDSTPTTTSNGSDNNGQTPTPPPTDPVTAPIVLEDISAPYVTGTSPKIGIKSVSPNVTIAAQLSRPLAAKTVNEQTVKVQDSIGNAVSGTVSIDTLGLSVQFMPSSPLSEGELYTVILGTGITDVTGNSLAQPYAWSFEITPPPEPPPTPPQDYKPPFVTGSTPSLGNVITSDDFSNAITFTFSEPLAENTVSNQTVYISDSSKDNVTGTLALDSSGSMVTFTPATSLHDSETYTVKLDTGITDLAGNAMTYPYSYSFKTSGTNTIAVTAGASSFLVLKENGTVWGWGQNNSGQLGDGTQIDRNKPVRALIDDVIAISQGSNFSVALKKDGTVWTWGDNRSKQLGDDTLTIRLNPGIIPNLTDVKAISAGAYFAMALKNDGTLWAWGYNVTGQLGIGTTDSPQPNPVQVQGITGTITAITNAGYSAAALVQSNSTTPNTTSIWTWGSNSYSQLGDGTTDNRSLPVQIKVNDTPLVGVAKIAYGENTLAAITDTGDLYLWGSNRYGQVGNPNLTINAASSFSTAAYLVPGKFKSVYMGPLSRSIFAVKTDNTLWGWGEGSSGQLVTVVNGDIQKTPLQLGTISNMDAIMGTRRSTVFLQKGAVFTSGFGVNGQWGNGTADYVSYRPYYLSNVPAPVSSSGMLSPTGWSGKDNMVIAAKDGTVWAWGSNQYCELGIASKIGQTQPLLAPVQVAPDILKNIKEVSRGGFHTLARDADGTVWAWGSNSYGQLGNNQTSETPVCTPSKVLDASGTDILKNVISISAGFVTSFAIQKAPDPEKTTVYAWGINNRGNLGLGNTLTPKTLPTAIPKFATLSTNVTKLASGSAHMLALTEAGDVYGWGFNSSYQAGISANKNDVHTPTQITTASDGPLGTVTDICTGAYTSLAMRESGTVVGWGINPPLEALGVATTTSPIGQPMPIANITNATQIACSGSRMNLALTTDGHLWSWGNNGIGGMGVGSTVPFSQPQQVPNHDDSGLFGDVQDISYAMAIRKDGTVWQFGYIPDGDPESAAHLIPVLWP